MNTPSSTKRDPQDKWVVLGIVVAGCFVLAGYIFGHSGTNTIEPKEEHIPIEVSCATAPLFEADALHLYAEQYQYGGTEYRAQQGNFAATMAQLGYEKCKEQSN